MDNKTWLRDFVIGNQPSQQKQTLANIIGGAILGGGFLGAINAPFKTYAQATKGVQQQVSGILPAFDVETQKAEAGLEKSLGEYQQRAVESAERGLEARGIGDRGVRAETAAGVKAGLSGAYATARAALARAKLNASSGLSGALANYQMGLAQKQYDSVMQKYASQAGIWGALGGLGTSILASQSKGKEKIGDYTSQLGEYETNNAPFRMKGVKDSSPLMLDPYYNRGLK